MTIKTGLVLGIGIGIGTIIGMNVSEDSKTEIINKVKAKIIFSLTGEEWEPKKPTIKSEAKPIHNKVGYTTSYNKVYTTYKERSEWEKILEFDSNKEAEEYYNKFKNLAEEQGYITVYEAAFIRDTPVDYTWSSYGWKLNDLLVDGYISCNKIHLSRPTLLKQ